MGSNPRCHPQSSEPTTREPNSTFLSSSHANGEPPDFKPGSSSSRGLSRPRMAKHRKKHVAAAMARVKSPILAGAEAPKPETGTLPYSLGSGLGRGVSGFGFGEEGRGKDGSFRATSSASGGGFVFGVGNGKGSGLKFDGGTGFCSSKRAGSWKGGSGLRATASVGDHQSKCKEEEKKNHFSFEKLDAKLPEEMERLNIGNAVGEDGPKNREELRTDAHIASGVVAPEDFVPGSENGATGCNGSLSNRFGSADWCLKDDKMKGNLSIFGKIWTKSAFPPLNKTVDLDQSAQKPSDGVVCSGANDRDKGVAESDRNLPPRVNRKNAHLFSDISDRYGVNGISCDPNCLSTEDIFCKKNTTFVSDDSTMKDCHSWKFKFEAIKKDGNICSGHVSSTESSCHMQSAFVNASSHPSSVDQDAGLDASIDSRQGSCATHFDFGLPDGHAMKDNLFGGMWESLLVDKDRGVSKDARQRRKMQKLRKPFATSRVSNNVTASKGSVPIVKADESSVGSYSPMDFSPFKEAQCSDQSSKVHKEEENCIFSNLPPISTTAVPTEHVSTENSSALQSCFLVNHDSVQDAKTGKNDHSCIGTKIPGSAETIAGFPCFSFLEQDSNCNPAFRISSNENDFNSSSFTFISSSSTQVPLSNSKRLLKKKKQKKVHKGSQLSEVDHRFNFPSLPIDLFPMTSCPLELDQTKSEGPEEISVDFPNKMEKHQLEVKETPKVGKEGPLLAAQKSCEKWRLRGNKAYGNGEYSKAEKYYTRGLNCVLPNGISRSCIHALVLCYSNRAAARMYMGKIREALQDCMMAVFEDPNFFKAQIRAANCHLTLGETEDATQIYRSVLQSGVSATIDAKVLKDASDGLQKSQQVAEYIYRSSKLLETRADNDLKSALEMISKALLLSPQSDELIQMKANALMNLRCYDEVIKLSEDTLESAECNSSTFGTLHLTKNDGSSTMWTSSRIWRCNLICKSHFYMGRLVEAVNFLKKHKLDTSDAESCGNQTLDSLVSLSVIMQELLRMKAAGNDAFQSGKYLEAVECYTASLSCNSVSRPFLAICFCNRAACYQALGQLADAIADCNLAIALNANYSKALSRRAALHEMIRNYGQACTDIRRLISLLEKSAIDRTGSSGKSVEMANNLRHAYSRLSAVEEDSKRDIPLDMYKILGVELTSSVSDIKKAYRKAALRHHPDKAAQFMVRSESSNDFLWNDLADEVRGDADSLFKMVGEAYAVLSDPTKRNEYDVEEEMRASVKKSHSWRNTNYDHCGKGRHKQRSKDSWESYEKSDERQYRHYRSAWW